jgi:hypothetical protein
MPKYKEKGKEDKGKGKGKEDREGEEVFYLNGTRVRRSKHPQVTGGYYVVKKGVCAIQLNKRSDGPIAITNPPVPIAPGDGWEYIHVREGNEIWGHAVFHLCYYYT